MSFVVPSFWVFLVFVKHIKIFTVYVSRLSCACCCSVLCWISRRLLGLTILQVGVIESVSGIFTYFVIYASYGFLPSLTLGIRDTWNNKALNSLEDSYGQEWVRVFVLSGWVFVFRLQHNIFAWPLQNTVALKSRTRKMGTCGLCCQRRTLYHTWKWRWLVI